MSVATSPRPRPEAIPDGPGVYLFKDADGRVIYVGKAISLRKRTASYFQQRHNLHPRTAAMVEASASPVVNRMRFAWATSRIRSSSSDIRPPIWLALREPQGERSK